jgi:hypothetical protein|tara:strand:+ start:116 stop:235 length:120 start_codon:yes stop_codon:yes gene_type:complete
MTKGKSCKGNTPMNTFSEGLGLYKQYVHNEGKEVENIAA